MVRPKLHTWYGLKKTWLLKPWAQWWHIDQRLDNRARLHDRSSGGSQETI